jgi:hypothetical protein
VKITVAPGTTGVLNVTVQAGGGSISRIEFGQPQGLVNASISVPGGPANQTQPFVFTPPANQTTVQFTVTAPNRAASTTAHFTVTDGCGPWPTFVGGGAGSF